MKLPSLSDLEEQEEQMNVYVHPAHLSAVVVGPPGSGKTSLAIWRALFIARQGQGVVLLTKNRMLSALANQLAREGEGGQFTTSTMHHYVWTDYKDRFGEPPTKHPNDYDLRWPELMKHYEAANVRPFVDHLIVDEGQNLPPEFFAWAARHCALTISIFADEHQTTVEGGSTMADLERLNIGDWFRLQFNHRNVAEIAALAHQFHRDRALPVALPKRGRSGRVPALVGIKSWDELGAMVATRLANQGGSVGVITYRVKHVDQIYEVLKKALPSRRVDSYTSLKEKGGEFIRMRDDGVTVLSGESAIGLEFDAVYLHDLARSLPIVDELQRRRLYMLTARAREVLFLLSGPTNMNLGLNPAQLAALPSDPYLVQ